ncbi:MAG: DUF3772 domain-containing protein, partial [Alphaproteobacteria bacterium]|nr:DUF3772 domain-containing protein [Alphaproteobacteria bacterium]
QALFAAFGASSLDFELRMILRDVNWKVVTTDEILRQINARFVAEGIEVPFAQTDIWLRNPEKLHPAQPSAPAKPVEAPSDGPSTAREASSMMDASDLHDTDTDGDADPDGPT